MITIRLARPSDNAFIHLLHDRHFENLTNGEFLKWVNQRNRRVYTIEYFGEPAGFAFIALERDAVRLCRIAIVDHYQRQHVASDAVRLILAKHSKRLIRAAFADDPDCTEVILQRRRRRSHLDPTPCEGIEDPVWRDWVASDDPDIQGVLISKGMPFRSLEK